MAEIVMWQCETCGELYDEYVNGCPRCWHGEPGTNPEPQIVSPVRAVKITQGSEAHP